jgi:hypothetical protein
MIKSILRNWLPIAVVITAMSGLVYLAVQQALRQGANDPQIQMAEDAATVLAHGGTVESVLPTTQVDLEQSIAPFITVFDDTGTPLASSGLLHGQMPPIPAGVFDYVRQHGEDRITWQPEPGVRQAIVVVSYTGSPSGFVVAGRSLREVERREDGALLEAGAAWLVTMFGSLVVVVGSEFCLSDNTPGRGSWGSLGKS